MGILRHLSAILGHLGAFFGPSWAHLGSSLGALGAILGHLADVRGCKNFENIILFTSSRCSGSRSRSTCILLPSWAISGPLSGLRDLFLENQRKTAGQLVFLASSRQLGCRLGAVLGASWGYLGPSLGAPVAISGHLVAILGHHGTILGCFGAIYGPLGAIWAILVPFWHRFGAVF